MTALGNSRAHDPETFTLLRKLANDTDLQVRRAAVTALGNSWADRPKTVSLLRDLAPATPTGRSAGPR